MSFPGVEHSPSNLLRDPREWDKARPGKTQGSPRLVLVLGGGNALGAYLAGACEHLHEQVRSPDWIIGASIGAVTGAILAGNGPDRRLAMLDRFWSEATLPSLDAVGHGVKQRQIYNGVHAAMTTMLCRPSIFRRRYPGLWSILPWVPDDVAIYDHGPLRATLERLVDFDLLNRGDIRFTVACTDLETGEEVYFDNVRDEIRPEHILASAAFVPGFPPVEIDGRLLCDPGYANNLPLDPVFEELVDQDFTCIAVDLFSLPSPRPASLDAVLERAQDIVFASPGHRRIKGFLREYELRGKLEPDGPKARLVHLAYRAPSHELAAKTLDFSPSSIKDRWASGRHDMAGGLALLGSSGDAAGRLIYLPVDALAAAIGAGTGAPSEERKLERAA